jgi:hypothetical protein
MKKSDAEKIVRKIQKAALTEDIAEVTKLYEGLRQSMVESIYDIPEQHRFAAITMIRSLDKEVSEICTKIELQSIVDELENDIIDKDLSVANSILNRYRGNV